MAGYSDSGTEKPVYFKNSELLEDKQNTAEYHIIQSVITFIGDVKCLQLDRELWRIYLKNKEYRKKLLREGFQLKSQTLWVYNLNPFSSVATNPRDPV